MTPEEKQQRLNDYPVNAIVIGYLKDGSMGSTLCGDKRDIEEAIKSYEIFIVKQCREIKLEELK